MNAKAVILPDLKVSHLGERAYSGSVRLVQSNTKPVAVASLGAPATPPGLGLPDHTYPRRPDSGGGNQPGKSFEAGAAHRKATERAEN